MSYMAFSVIIRDPGPDDDVHHALMLVADEIELAVKDLGYQHVDVGYRFGPDPNANERTSEETP